MTESCRRAVFCFLVSSAFLFSSVTANATTLDFTLINSASNLTYTWQLDSNPVPDIPIADFYFILNSVPAVYQGGNITLSPLVFFNAAAGGGLGGGTDGSSVSSFLLLGLQLYTGSEAAPIFVTGAFAPIGGVSSPWSLTIVPGADPPPGTVPEPASLILVATGIAGVMARVRRGVGA